MFEYPRTLGFSVTGGLVYRGDKIPSLQGAYIFGDYGSGKIWALRTNSLGKGSVERLTALGSVSAFGFDPSNGDVLLVDVSTNRARLEEGTIRRLVHNEVATGTPIPLTLAETGIFSDLATLAPEEGIIPYDVNLPFWADGAEKKHWFSVPKLANQITFNETNAWQFPAGTVFIEHFEIQTNDNPVAKRRLETRVLALTPDGVYGVTYRWTNEFGAVLLDHEGLDETIRVRRGGVTRSQVYHYPSQSECLMCHNAAAGFVLGFNTPQLNRDVTHGGETTNQIAALANAGYFTKPPADYHGLLALAGPADESVSQEFRVRSYLEANCAQCHRPGGAGIGNFDARISTPTDSANLINGDLVDNKGDPRNKTLVPKATQFSNINARIRSRASIQMPPITTRVMDADGAALILAFINGDSATRQSFAQWQAIKFATPLPPEAAATADPDSDGASNMLEWLAGTEPAQSADAWNVRARATNGGVEILVNQPANRGVVIEVAEADMDHWKPVDHANNRLTFPLSAGERIVLDAPLAEAARFYRARIVAP